MWTPKKCNIDRIHVCVYWKYRWSVIAHKTVKRQYQYYFFFISFFVVAIFALAAKFIKNWMHWHSPLSKREQCIFRSGEVDAISQETLAFVDILYSLHLSSAQAHSSFRVNIYMRFSSVGFSTSNAMLSRARFSENGKNGTVYRKCIQIQTPSILTIRETVHTLTIIATLTRWKWENICWNFAECMHPTSGTKKWREIICCNIKWDQLKLYI